MQQIECDGYMDCEAVCKKSDIYETAAGDAYELVVFRFLDTGYVTQPYCFPLKEDSTYRFGQSDIPYEYRGRTMADFNWGLYREDTGFLQRVVQGFINKWDHVQDCNQGLYIYSDIWGSGKTLLACCIANELIKRYNVVVKFVNITEYLDLCKDRGEVYNRLFDCDLLVVDDMGAQDTTKSYVSEMVYKLVNKRYSNHKITIYTSNLPYDSEKYEGRIRSRLMNCCQIIMPNQSIRRELAEQRNKNYLQELLEDEK